MPLYGFGSNIMGQLDQPEDKIFIHQPIEIPFFQSKKIVKIAWGKMHALVLCENNELYSWGVNDDYARGREGVDEEGIKQVVVNTNDQIIDICAGASYSAFLTQRRGYVYACGTFKSTNGIFGFNTNNKFGIGFQRIPNAKSIISISGGMNHILMLDKFQNIWSIGANESYQLGRKHRVRRDKYILVPMVVSNQRNQKENYKFINISAGGYHSVGINELGEAFFWGSNCNGQLGNESLHPTDHKYKIGLSHVVQVECGYNHTLMLTRDGTVYGCGENSQKQLGTHLDSNNEKTKLLVTPTKLGTGFCKIRSGGDFIILQRNNNLYAMGINTECECGLPNNIEDVSELTKIQFKFNKIIDYQCGGNFTLVYTE